MRMKLRKINNNAILGACVIIMMLLCALSISQPLIFEKQMANREAEVKEKLMLIRSAEERYRAKHGVYTGDFAVLVKAKYLKVEDTLIPYSDGRKFSLAATTIIHKSGKQIPLMEEERKKIKEKEIEERRVKSEGTESGTATHKVQSSKFQVQSNDIPAFLANGDRAKVLKVRRRIDLYGFRFATLLLQFPDYDNYELEATVLLDTLTSEAPALTHEQQEQLFHQIEEDYQDIPLKADRMKAIRQDQFFNALQVKFGYAVTCHKAQGGQWAHVYVDQGYMTDDMLNPDYIHWLYTAFTRATEMLYLVNWPETQTALE
jgi:hypothetical protein